MLCFFHSSIHFQGREGVQSYRFHPVLLDKILSEIKHVVF